MPIWEWLADAAGLLLIPLLIYAIALVVRRRWVTRNGGTIAVYANNGGEELTLPIRPLAAEPTHAVASLLVNQASMEVVQVLARMLGEALAQREAEQIIHDDPAVRALMAQFPGARIVPGSIKPL